jgi:subtilisin family serine protease
MQRRRLAFVAAVVAVFLLAPSTFAGRPLAGVDSTVDGHATWDSDMINIEDVTQTGAGVYVAVLDTGLVPNWADYFPKARVATQYGKGFYQNVTFKTKADDPCGVDTEVGPLRTATYIGSRSSSHGTHVSSTIIGYGYYSNFDAIAGFPLPIIQVRGIAPDATIIPVKVLADYQVPRLPKCTDPNVPQGTTVNFGTDAMVAAGIDYVRQLKEGPLAGHPVVINMSLGGDELSQGEQDAIDAAIAAGVVIVASAGNEGEAGMGYPGAYAPVISAGASGWTGEWLDDGASGNAPANGSRYRMWWLQDDASLSLTPPLYPGSGDVTDPTLASDVYVADFSSRELAGQDLDVVAPGTWVRGPFPGYPGYNHLPYWSSGLGDLFGRNAGNFYYVGGTSMAAPHVSAVAALMLEKDPALTAPQIETILESTALGLGSGSQSRQVWDPFNTSGPGFYAFSWNDDAVGSGLVQADAALAAVP